MWGAWEEIVWLEFVDFVIICKECKVTGLSDWITAEINDFGWFDFVELIDEFMIAASAWWVENDRAIWRYVFGNVFGFGEYTFRVGAFGVLLHFAIGGAVDFYEREVFVAGNG